MDGLYDPRCRRVIPAEWIHCDQCPADGDTWHLVPVEIVLEEDQEDDE